MPPWDAPELRAAAWPISIELDGHYPDTTVIVTMGYVYRRSPRQHRYLIWKAYTDHGLPADGSIPTPELFGANVAPWIMES
jgi:hypothetical protein